MLMALFYPYQVVCVFFAFVLLCSVHFLGRIKKKVVNFLMMIMFTADGTLTLES